MPSVPSLPTIVPTRSSPGESLGRAAELHDVAVGRHQFDAQHVVDRHAVFERVRPAGVRGDVAADRAGALARWIGRVVIAGARERLLRCALTTPGSTTA